MAYCVHCGHALNDGQRFCTGCGSAAIGEKSPDVTGSADPTPGLDDNDCAAPEKKKAHSGLLSLLAILLLLAATGIGG